MSNNEFIKTIPHFSEAIDAQCSYALKFKNVSDHYVDGLIHYITFVAKNYEKEWKEIKEEREKNARNN